MLFPALLIALAVFFSTLTECAPKDLKTIVRVVQVYSAENPSTTVKIPKFGSIGLQSSGKTQLAVIIAGRYIGGSIKGGVGTRCNIVYIFTNSNVEKFEVGQDLNNLETVTANEITAKVTAHNDAIAATPSGFSSETYYVRISTPDTIDFVINDKPGLLPAEADANNKHVERILHLELEGEDLIPLIMIAPRSSLDSDHLKEDLRRVFAACGNHVHSMRKAYVMFTQLDNLNGNDISKFVTYRDTVISQFQEQYRTSLPKSRIFFVSLKPHLLDPNTTKKSFDSGVPGWNYDNENNIIKAAKADSAQFLPEFLLRNLGKDWMQENLRHGLNFGLEPALAAIEKEVTDYVERNYVSIVNQIKKDGAALATRAKDVLNPAHDNDKIIKEVLLYVSLVSDGLEAIANTKPQHLLSALARAKEDGWPIAVPPSLALADEMRMTLEEDRLEAESTIGPISFAALAVTNKIAKTSELYKSLDSHYSASTAVSRVLSLFKFYVMSTELPVYPADVMWDKTGYVNEGKVDAIINNCIQKMVEENLVHFPTEEVVAWSTDIYTRMLPRVLAVLRDENVSKLLARYPKLHQHIDNALEVLYRNFFDNITKRAVASIAEVKKIQFSTLGVSKVESFIRLFGASNIAALKKLVQVSLKAPTEPTYFANLKNIPFMSDLMQQIPAASTLLNAAAGAAGAGGTQGAGQVVAYPHSFEFIGHLTSCSVEDFAVGEVIKMKQYGSQSDVEEDQQEINDVVHAVAHLSIGITALELVEVVKSTIIVPAMHVDSTVRNAMSSVVQHLRNDSYAQLKNLVEDDDTRLSSLQIEIKSITSWLNIATQLDSPTLASSITHLTTQKARLEKLFAEEDARIKAKTASAPPSDAEDFLFGEEDPAASASGADDCGKEKDKVTRELGNLKIEAIKLRELAKTHEMDVVTCKIALTKCQATVPADDLEAALAVAKQAKADAEAAKLAADAEMAKTTAEQATAKKAEEDAKLATAAAKKAEEDAKLATAAAKKAEADAKVAATAAETAEAKYNKLIKELEDGKDEVPVPEL